jgi:DNA-binding transcriptional regulator LsrR (DeoR family)
MKQHYDTQMMVQVSKMYYKKGLNQREIADNLGISRTSVSMILSEAKDVGIVEIKVKDNQNKIQILEDMIIERFSLKDCLVVPAAFGSPKLIKKILATQGARLAEKVLNNHSTVGITNVATCYELIHAFTSNRELSDVIVVPLIGVPSNASKEYQLNEMVRLFAEKIEGTPSFIFAPGIAETKKDKDLFMKSMNMQLILSQWAKVDAAIISVGTPLEFNIEKKSASPEKIKSAYELDRSKPVGEICARSINLVGEFIDNDLNSRVIGINECCFRNIKKVICIAEGNSKVLSIIAALRTRIISYLVIDEITAGSVLTLHDTLPCTLSGESKVIKTSVRNIARVFKVKG